MCCSLHLLFLYYDVTYRWIYRIHTPALEEYSEDQSPQEEDEDDEEDLFVLEVNDDRPRHARVHDGGGRQSAGD